MIRSAFIVGGVALGLFAYARPGSAFSFFNTDVEYPSILEYPAGLRLIDWQTINYFQPTELRGFDDNVDPSIMAALDQFRGLLGCRVFISPAPGAIARFADSDSRSQHYAKGRKSTAIDVMPEDCTLLEAYEAAVKIPAIGGIGIYPDWSPRPGLHLDTRKRKADGRAYTWMRAGATYAAIDWNVIDGVS